jgi:hypothetical protein
MRKMKECLLLVAPQHTVGVVVETGCVDTLPNRIEHDLGAIEVRMLLICASSVVESEQRIPRGTIPV